MELGQLKGGGKKFQQETALLDRLPTASRASCMSRIVRIHVPNPIRRRIHVIVTFEIGGPNVEKSAFRPGNLARFPVSIPRPQDGRVKVHATINSHQQCFLQSFGMGFFDGDQFGRRLRPPGHPGGLRGVVHVGN